MDAETREGRSNSDSERGVDAKQWFAKRLQFLVPAAVESPDATYERLSPSPKLGHEVELEREAPQPGSPGLTPDYDGADSEGSVESPSGDFEAPAPPTPPGGGPPGSAPPGGGSDASSSSIVNAADLKDAFKWAAGGFTALAAILTFFGLKEGTLDQALRLFPAATLCIFVFLGVGVVTALFAPAIEAESRMKRWLIYVGLFLMLLVAAVFYPNIDDLLAQEAHRSGVGPVDSTPGVKPWIVLILVIVVILALGILGIGYLLAVQPTQYFRWLIAGVLLVMAVALVASFKVIAPKAATNSGFTGEQRALTWGLSAGAIVVLAIVTALAFARNSELPTVAGLVILAVAATSLGLYGATKIALESKSLSVLPQVTGAIDDGDSGSVIVVSVKAGHLREQRLIVEVLGTPRDAGPRTLQAPTQDTSDTDAKVIWGAMLQPDALDDLDQTIKIPVVPTRWKNLSIRYCSVADDFAGPPQCVSGENVQAVAVRNSAPEPAIQQVVADITPAADGKLKARVIAIDVSPGVLTKIELCRKHNGKHTTHVTEATVSPDADGKISWEGTVSAGIAGDTLVLRQAICLPGSSCKGTWATLANYHVEGQRRR